MNKKSELSTLWKWFISVGSSIAAIALFITSLQTINSFTHKNILIPKFLQYHAETFQIAHHPLITEDSLINVKIDHIEKLQRVQDSIIASFLPVNRKHIIYQAEHNR